MKIRTKAREVTRSNVAAERQLTIKASAEAFEILSSGLYTDAVNAIVRELSANALDSHVAAGRADVPFDMHVPSKLEPYFYIRDYGTGLSNDDLLGLYSTYFDSTKDTSNEFIGAMGLGSKTPFSYTKDYQVTSWFDGVERQYAVFVNEDGIPSVALMAERESDAHTGLEVRINSTEGSRFANAISWYLSYFTVKPNVLNVFGYDKQNMFGYGREVEESDLNEEGKWFMAHDASTYSDIRVGAVYGQVPYPVNVSQITEHVGEWISDEAIQFYKNYADDIVFVFSVGMLSITANREELKYDKKTLAAFAARIEEMHDKFSDRVKALVEQFEHNDSLYLTVEYLYNEVFNRNDSFFSSIDYGSVDCEAYRQLPDCFTVTNWGLNWKRGINRIIPEKSAFEMSQLESYWSSASGENRIRNRKTLTSTTSVGIHPIVYYVIDEPRNGIGKAKHHFAEEVARGTLAFVLKVADFKSMKQEDFDAEFESIQDRLGRPVIIRTSTLAKPPRAPRAANTGGSTAQLGTVFRIKGYRAEVAHDVDLDDGGLYFYLAGGKRAHMGSNTNGKRMFADDIRESNFDQLLAVYNEAYDTTFTIDDVVGVSAADIKTFDKHDEWVNIFEAVKDVVVDSGDDWVSGINEARSLASQVMEVKRCSDSIEAGRIASLVCNIADRSDPSMAMTLPDTNIIQAAINLITEKRKESAELQVVANPRRFAIDLFGNATQCQAIQQRFDYDDVFGLSDTYSEINTKYPMLQYLASHQFEPRSQHCLQHLQEYIKMVDSQ